jgi:hypothetical protein
MLDPGDFLAVDRPSATKERPADTSLPTIWQLTWVRISETDRITSGRISETPVFGQAGTGAEKGAVFGREAGTRGRLQRDERGECPSSARGCLNAE